MSSLVETVTAVLSEAPSYTIVDNTNTKVSSFEKFIKALEDKLNLDLSNAVKRSKLELKSLYDAFKNRNYKITAAYFFSKNYNALQEIGYKSHWISLTDKKGKEIEILYKKEEEAEEEDPFFSFDNSDYKAPNVKKLFDILAEEGFKFDYLTELKKKDLFMYFKAGYLFAISTNKKEEKLIKSEDYELDDRYNQEGNPQKVWIKEL
jgi:hypothetical protein